MFRGIWNDPIESRRWIHQSRIFSCEPFWSWSSQQKTCRVWQGLFQSVPVSTLFRTELTAGKAAQREKGGGPGRFWGFHLEALPKQQLWLFSQRSTNFAELFCSPFRLSPFSRTGLSALGVLLCDVLLRIRCESQLVWDEGSKWDEKAATCVWRYWCSTDSEECAWNQFFFLGSNVWRCSGFCAKEPLDEEWL